ncbi:hypothetical protein LEP1GSC168_1253 [Leptospira santarosai str. HAI134]|nr:hypothetical protein LEP1GSC168_1253 [Leptospira santarosai str. HAI134]
MRLTWNSWFQRDFTFQLFEQIYSIIFIRPSSKNIFKAPL